MISCPQCQTSNEIGRETCISCGSELPGPNDIVCSNCQTINPSYLPICSECGTSLYEDEEDGHQAEKHGGAEDFNVEKPLIPDESNDQDQSGEVDWLEELKHVTGPLDGGSIRDDDPEDIPDWKEEIPVDSESGDSQLLGWLQEDAEVSGPDNETPEADVLLGEIASPASESGSEERPDTVTDSDEEATEAVTDTPETIERKELPLTAELARTMPLTPHHELDDLPEQLAKQDLPDWLDEAALPTRTPEVSEGIDDGENVPGLEELIDEVTALGYQESVLFDESLTSDLETEDILITDLPPDAPDWLVEIMDDSVEQQEIDETESDLIEDAVVDSDFLQEDDELSAENESEDERSHVAEAVTIAAAAMAAQIEKEPDEAPEVIDESVELLETETLASESPAELEEDLAEAGELIAMLDELPEGETQSDIVSSTLDADAAESAEEIPDWLQTIRPDDLVGAGFDPINPTVEADGPLAGLTGVIPVTATAAISKAAEVETQYQLTKEQKQQIALLERLTQGEQARKPLKKSDPGGVSSTQFRLIVGTILLVVILAGTLLPSVEGYVPGSANVYVPDGAEEAFEVTDELSGRPALVAFEYTPAMAGELDIVAGAFLQHLSEQNSPVLTISQVAAGVPMAERMVEQAEISEHIPLGLLPGEATGVRYLGTCIGESVECDLLSTQELGSDVSDILAEVGIIIVLAADRESLISWIEQVGSQSDVPIVAGVTQAMGPIASPFLASGQLVGSLDGLPGAAAYEDRLGTSSEAASDLLSSTILAQWTIIIALGGASIYFGLQSALKRPWR